MKNEIIQSKDEGPSATEEVVHGDQNTKAALLHQLGRHHYAIATTDTAFKHMLSLSMGSDSSIVISLLNCFVPAFREVKIKYQQIRLLRLRKRLLPYLL